MGFFSLKKGEAVASSASHRTLQDPATGDNEKSVLKVIRSFYGRRRYGKEKMDADGISVDESKEWMRRRSSAKDNPPSYAPSIITSLAESSQSRNESVNYLSDRAGRQYTPQRSSSDVITMTLAQRLNELAVANSDGLLDDDEYRLLRQNLFQRFATSSAAPEEVPVVRSSRQRTPRYDTSLHNASQIHVTRTPSVKSQSSITSTMSGLFRRTRSLRGKPVSIRDDVSVISNGSRASLAFSVAYKPRSLRRQMSDTSMRTQNSRLPHDVRSISSRHTAKSGAMLPDTPDGNIGSTSRFGSRTAEPPPSSFVTRNMSNIILDVEHLKTSADIRAEIQNIDTEFQRLLDAFNGLEVSAGPQQNSAILELTQSNRRHLRQPDILNTQDAFHSKAHSVISPATHHMSANLNSSITSISHLNSHPHVSKHKIVHILPHTPHVTFGVSTQQSSLSNPQLVTQEHNSHSLNMEPALSLSSPQYFQPNEHQNWLQHSSHQYSSMDDIRHRRDELVHRYQERIDYLRAKLKGAELHERLLKK
ncbi:hypothetical protein BD410DRAFT_901243 [Rickenella mellea]|uniref:Uncharacterized protein n=1 Tax=Rickenella mellea TaxID=50990 RepID=A0A4Y7PT17_9AGAM|nr:hypothetical protein BD410DRAFT_901243 [Rickenella mellea]